MKIDVKMHELIDKPLDKKTLSEFDEQLTRSQDYKAKIMTRFAPFIYLIPLLLGVGIYLMVGQWHAGIIYLPIGVLAISIIIVNLYLENIALKKYPASLIIDGLEYIKGTSKLEFTEVEVDIDNLTEDSLGRKFYMNILKQDRMPLFFENKIILNLIQ